MPLPCPLAEAICKKHTRANSLLSKGTEGEEAHSFQTMGKIGHRGMPCQEEVSVYYQLPLKYCYYSKACTQKTKNEGKNFSEEILSECKFWFWMTRIGVVNLAAKAQVA